MQWTNLRYLFLGTGIVSFCLFQNCAPGFAVKGADITLTSSDSGSGLGGSGLGATQPPSTTPSPSATPIPYVSVCTISDLDLIRANPKGAYQQTCDIDLSQVTTWVPLGSGIDSNQAPIPFSGIFDGNGKTVKGLNGSRGLFAFVTGTLKNITITGASLTHANSANILSNTGLLVAQLGSPSDFQNALVDNCSVSGQIAMQSAYAIGGLVGVNFAVIQNSKANVQITDTSPTAALVMAIGGLVGNNNNTISNSTSTGSITGGEAGIGGLVGQSLNSAAPAGTILNCSSSVTISSPNASYVGGLVGFTQGQEGGQQDVIIGSHSSGSVTGHDLVGGLVGYAINESIVQSSSTSFVTAINDNAGGLVGGLSSAMISQSYFQGTVAGKSGVGGIGGTFGANGCAPFVAVQDSYARGSVTGVTGVGGAFGVINLCDGMAVGAYVRHVYFSGALKVTAGGKIGGLVAELNSNSGVSNVQSTAATPPQPVFAYESNYWDVTSTSISSSALGEGLTTAQLKQMSGFTNWDAVNVWKIGADGYPDLKQKPNTGEGALPSIARGRFSSLASTPNGLIYGLCAGGGFCVSKDDAKSFSTANGKLNLGINGVTAGYLKDDGHIYLGTLRNGLYISKDNGSTFLNVGLMQGLKDLSVRLVTADANGHIYVITAGGQFAISVDDGLSFQTVTGTSIYSGSNKPGLTIDSAGTIRLSTGGRILTSQIGGLSRVSTVSALVFTTTYFNENNLTGITSNVLYGRGYGNPLIMTADAGKTLVLIGPAQGLPYVDVYHVDLRMNVDPTTGTIFVIAGTTQTSQTSLFVSNIGGLTTVGGDPKKLTFTQIAAGQTDPFAHGPSDCVAVSKTGRIIVATSWYDVISSTDGGATFTQASR